MFGVGDLRIMVIIGSPAKTKKSSVFVKRTLRDLLALRFSNVSQRIPKERSKSTKDHRSEGILCFPESFNVSNSLRAELLKENKFQYRQVFFTTKTKTAPV